MKKSMSFILVGLVLIISQVKAADKLKLSPSQTTGAWLCNQNNDYAFEIENYGYPLDCGDHKM